jgi:opacity protein-like surface antigen
MGKLWMVAGALALAVTTAGTAQAQSDTRTGAYIALDAGIATVSDTDLDYREDGGTFGGTGATDTLNTRVELDSAFNIGGAIGYDFGQVRADIEIDYNRNKVSALEVRGVNGSSVTLTPGDIQNICDYAEADDCSGSGNTIEFDGGRVRQLSAIASLWYDIPTGSVVTPYLGGGVGVAGFEIEGEGKARFAWHLGAGVAVEVSPGVSLTADYRFRRVGGTTFTDDEYPEYALEVGRIQTSTFSAGLRFTF